MTDEAVFRAARRIADLWHESVAEEVAAGGRIECRDRRGGDPNSPYHDRTSSGLLVEWYYTSPSWLHTPWGRWRFAGPASGSAASIEGAVVRFLGKFDAELDLAVCTTPMGLVGPVYEVRAVDGNALPPAVRVECAGAALREELDTQWARLTDNYNTRETR